MDNKLVVLQEQTGFNTFEDIEKNKNLSQLADLKDFLKLYMNYGSVSYKTALNYVEGNMVFGDWEKAKSEADYNGFDLKEFENCENCLFSLEDFKPITWRDWLSLNLESSKYFDFIKEVCNDSDSYDLDFLKSYGLDKLVKNIRDDDSYSIHSVKSYDTAKKFEEAYNDYNHID